MGEAFTNKPVVFHREWRRPRLTVYRAAEPRRLHAVWNRYDTCTIGAALQISGRVFSLVWARPRAESP